MLAAWDWADRPAGVITLPSRSRPQLIESLGRQIAEVGRMPYLGPIEYAGGIRPAAAQFNSAQRLRALWDTFTFPGPCATPSPRSAGRCCWSTTASTPAGP